MCLAIPAKLVEQNNNEGRAELHGMLVPVNTLLVPQVKVGDWILVHAGFAIQRIDAQTAEETWAVLEDLQHRVDKEECL